jgi:ribosomal protein S26
MASIAELRRCQLMSIVCHRCNRLVIDDKQICLRFAILSLVPVNRSRTAELAEAILAIS